MKIVALNVLFLSLFLISCGNNKREIVYYNETFENIHSIANNDKRPFCIVLVDSTQKLSQRYCRYLKDQKLKPTNKVIYNIVDINYLSNEWYMKWLCPVSLPLTCVFSSDGALVDLVPGAAKETFLYTDEALSNMTETKFHYLNRFNLSKQKIIPLLNQVLECRINLNQGLYTSTALGDSIDSLRYPYSYYLRLVGELMENDTLQSKFAAESMMTLENPYYLELYRDEFVLAKKTLNPNFDINDEPNIRVNKAIISLSNCKSDENIPIEVLLYNDGHQPLEVQKIFTSCSCLKQMDHTDDFVVAPKDSTIIKFSFKSEERGEIARDIFITSNAINMPILYIKVLANIL